MRFEDLTLEQRRVFRTILREQGDRAALAFARKSLGVAEPEADRDTERIADGVAKEFGFAVQESAGVLESVMQAHELLAADREELGPAYKFVHLLARFNIETATQEDPAPHLMTTYWTLGEMLGVSTRTVQRYLEPGHSYSEAVSRWISQAHNLGTMQFNTPDRLDQTIIVATVLRFFPRGRLSKQARVKLWGERDIIADSLDGLTERARIKNRGIEKPRYRRAKPLMSPCSLLEEQAQKQNWLWIKLGKTVTERQRHGKSSSNIYGDIPRKAVLRALRSDFYRAENEAKQLGKNARVHRSAWVGFAARLLSGRFKANAPPPGAIVGGYYTEDGKRWKAHEDGFTKLMMKVLWVVVRAELYGGESYGWHLLERMFVLAEDAEREGLKKPLAFAWKKLKKAGFGDLMERYPQDVERFPVGAKV